MSELSPFFDPLPITSLFVSDEDKSASIKNNVLTMALRYNISSTTELAFTVYDKDLGMENNRYFEIGREVRFNGRKYEIASVEIAYSSTPVVSVVCRPQAVQQIRRMKRTGVYGTESASDVAAETAAKVGLEFFGEYVTPSISPIVTAQSDNQDQNLWNRLYEEARANDFEFFEANGTLFFASQKFILDKQPVGDVDLKFPVDEDEPLYPLEPARFRRSGDSRDAATASFIFRRTPASVSMFPGMSLKVEGLKFFEEPFMVRAVNIPISKGSPVSVDTSTVLEPEDTSEEDQTQIQTQDAVLQALLDRGVSEALAQRIVGSVRNSLIAGVSLDYALASALASNNYGGVGTITDIDDIIESVQRTLDRLDDDTQPPRPPRPQTNITRLVWDWDDLSNNAYDGSSNLTQQQIAGLGYTFKDAQGSWAPNSGIPNPAMGREWRPSDGTRLPFIVIHTAETHNRAAPNIANRQVVINYQIGLEYTGDPNTMTRFPHLYSGYHVLIDEGGWVETMDFEKYNAHHVSNFLNSVKGSRGLGISFACYARDWPNISDSRRAKLWANVKDYLEYKSKTSALVASIPLERGNTGTNRPVTGIYAHGDFDRTSKGALDGSRTDPGSTFPWNEFINAIQ